MYFYPAQTDPKVFPLGGDERYKLSADGKAILEDHCMHRTILDIPMASPPAGYSTAAPIGSLNELIHRDRL